MLIADKRSSLLHNGVNGHKIRQVALNKSSLMLKIQK